MIFSGVGTANNGRVDGIGTIAGGVYGDLQIDGVCEVNGDLEVESLKIDGVCTCNGNVMAKTFHCNGVLTIKGNLRAGALSVDGVVDVNGSKMEADRIDCDGFLRVHGEVSADVIEADGLISAEEIVGDRILIKSYRKRGLIFLLSKIGEKIAKNYSAIRMIEGSFVDIQGVRADVVSGHTVLIGKNCEIGRVDADGELQIHPTAQVGEIVGQ